MILFHNPIGAVGAIEIAKTLKNHPLTHLDFGKSDILKIGDGVGKNGNRLEGIIALAEVMKNQESFAPSSKSKTLRTLNLSYNPFGNEGAAIIADALKNSSLSTLNLSSAMIGNLGAAAIAEALKTNHSLYYLDLSRNNIDDSGATAIAEALLINKSLKALDLSYNNISDVGTSSFAKALKTNKSLQTLSLSYQRDNITDSGAAEIAEALKTNHTLFLLYLAYSRITDHGAEALGEALKINNTLRILDLSRNNIRESGCNALGAVLETNSALSALNLCYNPCDRIERKHVSLFITREDTGLLDDIKLFHPHMEAAYQTAIQHSLPPPAEKISVSQKSETYAFVPHPSPAAKPLNPPSAETLYLQGKVLEQQELPAALALFLDTAKRGHAEALQKLHALKAYFQLGCYFEDGKESSGAAFFYSKAAAEGDLNGKEALGRMADPYAKSLLALLLEKGSGMKRNIEKAIALHKAAAREGIEVSKLHLGMLYYLGFSTEADQQAAIPLIEEADLNGFPEAASLQEALLKEIQAKEKIIRNGETIDQKLYQLSCLKQLAQERLLDQIPLTDSITKEQEVLLNQRKRLAHNAFTAKISQLFAAVNSFLKGEPIQITGIGQFAIQKLSKEKCLRIQSYHLDSTALASGFVFRFQDLIHQLDAKSLDRFTDHCLLIFTDYLFEKAPHDATTFELLMGGTPSPLNRYLAKKLKTDKGLEWTIEDLYFSSGLRTLYGGIYHPKGTDSLPFYRWGTREEVEILESMGIEMMQIQEERIDHLVAKVDRKLAAARYLQEAESLAKQYLA